MKRVQPRVLRHHYVFLASVLHRSCVSTHQLHSRRRIATQLVVPLHLPLMVLFSSSTMGMEAPLCVPVPLSPSSFSSWLCLYFRRNTRIQFTGGTECDLTGVLRSTTVHLKCGSVQEVREVTEDRTCHYRVLAISPLLCR